MFPTKTGEKVLVNQDELLHRYPGTIGGKTGFTESAQKTFVAAADRGGTATGGRDDVRADQRGRPDLLGSGRRAAGLGLRSGPEGQYRLTLTRELLNRNASETSLANAPSTLGARAKVVGRVDHHAVRGVLGRPPTAWAEPGVEPAGAVAIPEGPAQAWLLADLDNGRILASRNPYEPHAPASTIKALLAMVVLDQLARQLRRANPRTRTWSARASGSNRVGLTRCVSCSRG